MKVPFQKWHGCKNNFLVIFSTPNQKELLEALKKKAPSLCSKDGSSIGADGILLLQFEESSPPTFTPKKLVIINQDGSEAQNCGNGLRCAALACYKRALDYPRKIEIPDSLELAVRDNTFLCRFSDKFDSLGLPDSVTVSMGTALLNEDNSWHGEAIKALEELRLSLTPSLSLESTSTCDLSNKHIVLLTGAELDEKALGKLAKKLQHSYSWDGINVHMAKELEDKETKNFPSFLGNASSFYEVLHWERGCGPTQGCGSGACSLAASVFAEGFLEDGDTVAIKMPGGFVGVTSRGKNTPLELKGPASFVFEGIFDL